MKFNKVGKWEINQDSVFLIIKTVKMRQFNKMFSFSCSTFMFYKHYMTVKQDINEASRGTEGIESQNI